MFLLFVAALKGSTNFIELLAESFKEIMIDCSLGCKRISSADGREFGSGSIMRLISCSSCNERFALGENFITPSPACLSFYHNNPF
jgi:hypothetical protein